MKIQWRVTPAGAHVAQDVAAGFDVANVYKNRYTGIIQAYPWGRGVTNVGSFEEGKAHCEKLLGAEVLPALATLPIPMPEFSGAQDDALDAAVLALNADCTKQPSITPRTLAEVAAIIEQYDRETSAERNAGPEAWQRDDDDYNFVVETIRAAVKAPVPLAERACSTCKRYREPTDRPPCSDCLRNPVTLAKWEAA